MGARRWPAAGIYGLSFVVLAVLSGRLLGARGSCADVGAFGLLQARSSLGATLPVPVVQMCSGYTLPVLLIAFTLLACAAWYLLMRYDAKPWLLAVCAACALGAALAFPYVPSTDPYAYATYGYEAVHGASPYATQHASQPNEPLKTLYRLFPPQSWNRTANYGPVAVAEYQTIAAMAGNSLLRYMQLSRVTNALLAIALAFCLAMLRPQGTAWERAAFAAFHPLVILESVAFVHGDIFFIVLLAAALLAYRKGAVPLCVVLIVLATEVRAVAGLAFVVLLLQLAKDSQHRAMLRAIVTAAIAGAASIALSVLAYGSFTLGGSPAAAPYSAPFALLFDAFGVSRLHLVAGGALQAIFGLTLIALALRARLISWIPQASLAMLPIVQAWYCQWVVPVIAIEPGSAMSRAAIATASLAILAEWTGMTGHSDALTWSVILAFQWLVPVAILFASARTGEQHVRVVGAE